MRKITLTILFLLAPCALRAQVGSGVVPWLSSTPPTFCPGATPLYAIGIGFTGQGTVYGNSGTGTGCAVVGGGGGGGPYLPLAGGTLTGPLNIDTYAHSSTTLANIHASAITSQQTTTLPLTGWTGIDIHGTSLEVGVGATSCGAVSGTCYVALIAQDTQTTGNFNNYAAGGNRMVDTTYEIYQHENPGANSTILQILGNGTNDAIPTQGATAGPNGLGRWRQKYQAALFSAIMQVAIPSTSKTIPTATSGWTADTTYAANHGVSCTLGSAMCSPIVVSYTRTYASQPIAIAFNVINGNYGWMTCVDSQLTSAPVTLVNTLPPWITTVNGKTQFPFVFVWNAPQSIAGSGTITCTVGNTATGATEENNIMWVAPVPLSSGMNPVWVQGTIPESGPAGGVTGSDGNSAATGIYNQLAANVVADALQWGVPVNWINLRNCVFGTQAQAAASPNSQYHLNNAGYSAWRNCYEAPTFAPHKQAIDIGREVQAERYTAATDAISPADRDTLIWYSSASVAVTLLQGNMFTPDGEPTFNTYSYMDWSSPVRVYMSGATGITYATLSGGTTLSGKLSGYTQHATCMAELYPFFEGPPTFWTLGPVTSGC